MGIRLEAKCKTEGCAGIVYLRDMTESEIAAHRITLKSSSPLGLMYTCGVCGKVRTYTSKDLLPPQMSDPGAQ
jgi:hypothetical protein